jgi:hypothetical protein
MIGANSPDCSNPSRTNGIAASMAKNVSRRRRALFRRGREKSGLRNGGRDCPEFDGSEPRRRFDLAPNLTF